MASDEAAPRGSPSTPIDAFRSALMRRVRRKGTAPELLVAAALRELGLTYRKNAANLPGSPDFVNRRRGWAVFVQGCYWHHHRCKRGTTPTRNREFWVAKFAANRSRDARKARQLRALGFRVLLVWECEAMEGDTMYRKLNALVPKLPAGANAGSSSSSGDQVDETSLQPPACSPALVPPPQGR